MCDELKRTESAGSHLQAFTSHFKPDDTFLSRGWVRLGLSS